jgi:predicted DNA-binding transcriptional regulator AlpA
VELNANRPDGDRRVLRTEAAALYLGLRPGTLEKARRAGDGPPFLRIGARVVGYDVRDLDAWIATRKQRREPEGT